MWGVWVIRGRAGWGRWILGAVGSGDPSGFTIYDVRFTIQC